MQTDGGGTTNLGPGYRFHYLPNQPPSHPFNVDSAEYANITIHFLLFHAQARAAGMAPLPRADHAMLEAWVERVLLGYWTHAGFLNWDSGLGLDRWQIGKTFAFAQQGLIAIAKSPAVPLEQRVRARGRSTCSTAASCSTSGGRARTATASSRRRS